MDEITDQPIGIKAIHEKIGRNLLLFQQLELMLKAMLSIVGVSGHPADLAPKLEKRKAEIRKLTLGPSVGQHIDSLNQKVDDDDWSAGPPGKAPYLSIQLSSHCEVDVLEKRKAVLAGLVDERNDLVHHLLTRHDMHDQKVLQALGASLDDQHRRLTEEVNLTHELGLSQFETRKEIAKLLDTKEARAWFSGKATNAEFAAAMQRAGYEAHWKIDEGSREAE